MFSSDFDSVVDFFPLKSFYSHKLSFYEKFANFFAVNVQN